MKELKLIRWYDDGFPPIDLNENVMAVTELVREVKRLRAALSPAKQEWVSVKERLPECDTWVLGYSARAFRFSRQMVVLFGQDAFFAKGFELHPDEVTHWKSLDEPALPYTEEK